MELKTDDDKQRGTIGILKCDKLKSVIIQLVLSTHCNKMFVWVDEELI